MEALYLVVGEHGETKEVGDMASIIKEGKAGNAGMEMQGSGIQNLLSSPFMWILSSYHSFLQIFFSPHQLLR